MTPRLIPATSATGMLTIRAITAPAMARSRRLGPKESAEVKPCVGWVRIAENAESAPAIAHASPDIRPEKMPAIRAASGFAAEARMARPCLL
ncbi:unannotated protein [freshwater metagenome]|uniref:Unannotated protein n=1 Tax=freshwater metagenome TaxID=449393 RepID=A0A6J6RHM6_9ZZZZ